MQCCKYINILPDDDRIESNRVIEETSYNTRQRSSPPSYEPDKKLHVQDCPLWIHSYKPTGS
jgi:hypothetical protein